MIIESEAKCHGKIILNPRGKGGFGYDPIFEESATRLTFAEMNNDIKDFCSHRGKACLLYTSPSPRDKRQSRMPSSA